jgi:hypothetical protein
VHDPEGLGNDFSSRVKFERISKAEGLGREAQSGNQLGSETEHTKTKREGVAGATALSSLRALHRLQNENLALS